MFSRLPHGSDYASRLIECLATGYLVAVVESICIREMQRHVDAAAEVVVGRTVQIEHKAPIPPGSSLKLRGWVERLGERSATFCVQASDDHEIVCESSIKLVAARRASMESRIASKVNALRADAIDTGTPSGRFFFHVMASLAEMERELTVERTRAGLEVARQLGRKGGRKRKMTDSKIESAKKLLASGLPPKDVAKNLGVSVPTLYRWVPASAHA